jgi:CDGSH-type Zn-finger protein
MSEVVAKVLDSGPIQIVGEVEMLDGAGNPYKARKLISLCRCGKTRRAPYCDFSHQEAGFDDACRADRFTESRA